MVKIKNKAVVNEDPNAKLIRELKEELERLRLILRGGSEGIRRGHRDSGYLTAAVVLVYVLVSLATIAGIPPKPRTTP